MKKRLRIGMVAPNVRLPPVEGTLPKGVSGAIEWNAYELAEGLVGRGHDVTLFAGEGSETSAKLESIVNMNPSQNTLENQNWPEPEPTKLFEYELALISRAYQMAKKGKFDILHSHLPTKSALFAPLSDTPTIATLHSPLHLEIDRKMLEKNPQYYISISENQRTLAPKLNYFATIPHGINPENFLFSDNPENFLIYFGRIAPDKGVSKAIQIAKESCENIMLLGDPFFGSNRDVKYWKEQIEPYIDGTSVIHQSFVGRDRVQDYVSRAKAFLFPLQWDEPFGYTMIESMAVGTPVVAYSRGSVPEIVRDGETGFVVEADNLERMVESVKNVDQINRKLCRQHVVDNFALEREVDRYVDVYNKALDIHNSTQHL